MPDFVTRDGAAVTPLTVLSEGRAHRGFGFGVCVGVLLAGVVYLVGLVGYLLAVAW